MKLADFDEEMVFTVLSQLHLSDDADIQLSMRDIELLLSVSIQDMAQGGDPLFDIQINQQKLQQLLGRVRAQQQIAETTGEIQETHSDREDGVYDFCITDDMAMYHVLMNANAIRQMAGLPDIAPAELLNTASTYPYELREAMRSMVMVTVDLELLNQAVEFARRSELEADKHNPYRNSEGDAV